MFTFGMTESDVSIYTAVTPTHMSNHDDIPPSLGFLAAAVAVVFFGSNLVPVKKFETGDGEMSWLFHLCGKMFGQEHVEKC